jgi:hypothetical protein
MGGKHFPLVRKEAGVYYYDMRGLPLTRIAELLGIRIARRAGKRL